MQALIFRRIHLLLGPTNLRQPELEEDGYIMPLIKGGRANAIAVMRLAPPFVQHDSNAAL
jgi:hypothetical protein